MEKHGDQGQSQKDLSFLVPEVEESNRAGGTAESAGLQPEQEAER